MIAEAGIALDEVPVKDFAGRPILSLIEISPAFGH
jgi:hypothetical protein